MRIFNIAAFWMVLVGMLSVTIVVIAKSFGSYFHPFQIMFFYCALGALVLLPAIIIQRSRKRSSLPTSIRWRYHLMRSVLEFTAFSLTFYSLMHLPLPMQTAIGYTVPLFASLFAVLIVGEVITPRIMVSLALGLLGICIIHNPFTAQLTDDTTLGIAAALSASAIFGICGSLIKLSTHSTPPLLIAMIMLTFTSITALPFALSVWMPPLPEQWLLLAALGICTALVQYCVSRALTLGLITKLVPLTYLNLIWASLFAYFLFDELIDEHTILGSLFIFSAVMVVSMKRRKAPMKEVSQQTSQP